MGCTSNEVEKAPNPRRKARKPASKPISTLPQSAEFEAFGDEIRRELDPTSSLERLLAECVIEAAWRLNLSIERKRARKSESSVDSENITTRKRVRPTATENAARLVRDAFEAFEACRKLMNPRGATSFLFDKKSVTEVESNEWPIVPSSITEVEPRLENEEISYWQDRLVFDFHVSDVSPVVKGTWVTVGHVVSLIVDGWTWSDILRSHPELTEDDIRGCVSYAMEEESADR